MFVLDRIVFCNEVPHFCPPIFSYLLPAVVAALSYILRWLADFTCSEWSQTCRASSELLSHIYMVVFFFLVIVGSTKAKQLKEVVDRLKAAYSMIFDAPSRDKRD